MGQILHGSATTTHAIRAAIQRSKAPLKELVSDSNASFPRLTAASTRWGSAVQTKGFGLELVSARNRLDGSLQIDDGAKDAALEAAPGEFGEEPFYALSHDAEVGVKWNVQRGCRVSHLRTCGCLWVA